ncbi:MAG: hypothetical protein M3R10_02100 [Verrucomicrobiota bacterium]|nr:hypothetical protein [Verrucomicrobiota bacterium]
MRRLFLLALVAALGIGWIWVNSRHAPEPTVTRHASTATGQHTLSPQEIARTWGNPNSLPDHFARHGRDFGARNADEYALMAYQFLRRAAVEGYPAKIDGQRVLRIFDPKTGSFGAYNPDGTTKTFFKPGNARYFDRQPGQAIDLRTRS